MMERVPCGTNEPTVLECSWLPKRELMGRGRVAWTHQIVDLQGNITCHGPGIYIDGGTLDLGIVRDSQLNATNDFQVFGETFAVAIGDDPRALGGSWEQA